MLWNNAGDYITTDKEIAKETLVCIDVNDILLLCSH